MARKTSPSHTNLILLFYGAITVATAVLLWVFVNTSLHTYRAANLPNGVNISISNKTATYAPNQIQTSTVTIKPSNPDYEITAFNVVLKKTGNLEFIRTTTPTGFDEATQSLFHTVSADQVRMAYIVYLGDPVPQVTFDVSYKGTALGAGGFEVSVADLEVVGTLNEVTFVPDVIDTASFTFANVAQTPVPPGSNPTATPRPGITTAPGATNTPIPLFTVAPTRPPGGGGGGGVGGGGGGGTNPTTAPQPTTAPNPTTPPAPTTAPNPTTRPQPTTRPGGGGTGGTGGGNQPVPVTIKIVLRLQGIGTGANTPQTAKITLRGPTNISITISLVPGSSGTYEVSLDLNSLVEGNYQMLVKGDKQMQKRICSDAPNESEVGDYNCEGSNINLTEGSNLIDASGITLMSGDLGAQDGVIDSADLAAVRQRIGSRKAEDLAVADINHDKIVDTQDFSLVMYSIKHSKYDQN